MPVTRSSLKILKTLVSSQSPQAKSAANPVSTLPSSEPPSQSTPAPPSFRRSLRLSSIPLCAMSSEGRNGKRKSDSEVLIAKGDDKGGVDVQSGNKRKPSTRNESQGVKIEGPVEEDMNLKRNQTEEGSNMRLRSGSITKRKIRDEDNDCNKVEENDKIGDDLSVKKRVGLPNGTKLIKIGDEIGETVNLVKTMNLRSCNKLKEKEKLVVDKEFDKDAENNLNSKRKLSYQEKGKGKMEIKDNSNSEIAQNNQSSKPKFSYEEKGKAKVIIDSDSDFDSDSGSGSDSDSDRIIIGDEMGNSRSENYGLVPEKYHNLGDEKSVSRRDADRNRALKLAPKFAFFKDEERGESDKDEDSLTDSGIEDWPGPFSTAMKIIQDRESKLKTREINNLNSKRSESSIKIPWVPSRNLAKKQGSFCRTAPSLKSLSMKVLVDNADEIESLEGIPDFMKGKIVKMLCDSRKMNLRFFEQILKGNPEEICLSDCSWVSEKDFEGLFSKYDTSSLQVLKLDLSGRCMPDYILNSTLTNPPKNLNSLKILSLKGAYSLSDEGLNSLISSSPSLSSINLSHSSLITSKGVINLITKLSKVIREICLDECQNVNAMEILNDLVSVEYLEVLSMEGILSVSDKFVKELVVKRGLGLKKVSFAGCTKLTSSSIKSIGENCPNLLDLDIRNLTRLNDSAIAYLANGCASIRKLQLRRNSFSDEAVAAFVEASGANLIELSLNNVQKVGHHTALAIYRKCRVLKSLDLSFCRKMSDEALGLIIDTCLSLRIVKLFGCTQIKGHFLDGHSNSLVKVLGLTGNILEQFDLSDLLDF